MDFDDLVIPVFLVICILVIGGLFFIMIEENKRWEEFKIEHNCRLVTRISGDVFNRIETDVKGNISIGVGTTSDKEGWACDDGVTYYR